MVHFELSLPDLYPDSHFSKKAVKATDMGAYLCEKCVAPNTIVAGHYMPTENYKESDFCLGYDGPTAVQDTFTHQYDGNLIDIKAQGALAFQVTPEHPVLVATRTRRSESKLKPATFSELHWKKAGELNVVKDKLNGDYLVIPRKTGFINSQSVSLHKFTTAQGIKVARGKNMPLDFPITNETAWLLGLYMAEGNSTHQDAMFSLNKKEVDITAKVLSITKKLGYKSRIDQRRTAQVVILPSRLLARALPTWCGKRAANKRVPNFILYHTKESIIKNFLDGYLIGDGCQVKNHPNVILAPTISKILALQVQLLAARIGIMARLHEQKHAEYGMIEGRKVRLRTTYEIFVEPRKHLSRYYIRDNHIIVPIRKLTQIPYSGLVHNLGTTSNTFLANNAVVHNCNYTAPEESWGFWSVRQKPTKEQWRILRERTQGPQLVF